MKGKSVMNKTCNFYDWPVLMAFVLLCLPAWADAPRGFIGDTGSGWSTISKVQCWPSTNLPSRVGTQTVDGSGISADGLTHDGVVFGGMWMSTATATNPYPGIRSNTQWIRFDLDKIYQLGEMLIWNWNDNDYPIQGMKRVRIIASTTDTAAGYLAADANPVFDGIIPMANATGADPVNLVVDFAGLEARYILIYVPSEAGNNSNWSNGTLAEVGLSEVRFYPVYAPKHFIGDAGSGWNTTSKVTAYCSGNALGRLPIYTVDGSNISAEGMSHDNFPVYGGMWLSLASPAPYPYVRGNTQWLRFDFDKVYNITEMWIWNYNESAQFWDGPSCGMKQVRIIASIVDTEAGWLAADTTPVFEGTIAKADGTNSNFADLKVNFASRQARYVLMYIPTEAGVNHNWSNGAVAEDGLSEVRFYRSPADCNEAIQWGNGIVSDLNADCRVNLADFAELAQDWMQCINPQDVNCL